MHYVNLETGRRFRPHSFSLKETPLGNITLTLADGLAPTITPGTNRVSVEFDSRPVLRPRASTAPICFAGFAYDS